MSLVIYCKIIFYCQIINLKSDYKCKQLIQALTMNIVGYFKKLVEYSMNYKEYMALPRKKRLEIPYEERKRILDNRVNEIGENVSGAFKGFDLGKATFRGLILVFMYLVLRELGVL